VFLCSPTGDHSQKDLAKFGNRPDMKVEIFKNPFVFWLLAKTCCKILAIYMYVCVGQIQAIFSQKSFACVKTIVLSLKKKPQK
jgi:hypothetical protein